MVQLDGLVGDEKWCRSISLGSHTCSVGSDMAVGPVVVPSQSQIQRSSIVVDVPIKKEHERAQQTRSDRDGSIIVLLLNIGLPPW